MAGASPENSDMGERGQRTDWMGKGVHVDGERCRVYIEMGTERQVHRCRVHMEEDP